MHVAMYCGYACGYSRGYVYGYVCGYVCGYACATHVAMYAATHCRGFALSCSVAVQGKGQDIEHMSKAMEEMMLLAVYGFRPLVKD